MSARGAARPRASKGTHPVGRLTLIRCGVNQDFSPNFLLPNPALMKTSCNHPRITESGKEGEREREGKRGASYHLGRLVGYSAVDQVDHGRSHGLQGCLTSRQRPKLKKKNKGRTSQRWLRAFFFFPLFFLLSLVIIVQWRAAAYLRGCGGPWS